MGFDAGRIPKVREALRGGVLPVTAVRHPEDVRISEATGDGARLQELALDALEPEGGGFRPHPGWSGHVERTSCAA